MDNSLRPLKLHERELLERLLEPEFPGRDELRCQMGTVMARQIFEDGTLELRCSACQPAPVKCRVPTEGECRDVDGGVIQVLLHVVDGVMHELEGKPGDRRDVIVSAAVSLTKPDPMTRHTYLVLSALLILAAPHIATPQASQPCCQADSPATAKPAQPVTTVRGSDKAPITILVFSDFESFPCARSASVIDGLLQQTRDVRVIFKHAPAASNPNALLAHGKPRDRREVTRPQPITTPAFFLTHG